MGKRLRPRDADGSKTLSPPGVSKPASTQHLTPVFCLRHLGGQYCLSRCDQELRAAFADTLHKLSRMTWAEIAHGDRHKSGYEILPQNKIKAHIPEHITPDVNLLAFRFHSKRPMVGYRDGRTFHVLFLDRDFSLYDHGS